MRETGWLIESGAPWAQSRQMYRRTWVNSGMPSVSWTDDSRIALRFCRKEDATLFWYLHSEPANIPKITEHVWIDGVRAPQPIDAEGQEKQP